MNGRDRFEVVDGGRDDDDPISQDDQDALAALADVLAGPHGGSDPEPGDPEPGDPEPGDPEPGKPEVDDLEVAARARALACDIMGLPDDSSSGLRPVDGPPAD